MGVARRMREHTRQIGKIIGFAEVSTISIETNFEFVVNVRDCQQIVGKYLVGQNFGGQNCRKFGLVPKILSVDGMLFHWLKMRS